MKERKHLMDYLAEMMLIFGITLLIITVICCLLGEEAKEYSTMFALGSKGVSANTILQFLLSSACITGLRFLFFSDRIFKKMSIAKRTIIMLLSVIVLIGVFAYIFDWFPVTNLKCWLSFFVCFGICFIVSVVISYLKENMDNKQLADGLNRIKEEQNGITNRGK
jgi:magnesium-transporting ATPase (P-type)